MAVNVLSRALYPAWGQCFSPCLRSLWLMQHFTQRHYDILRSDCHDAIVKTKEIRCHQTNLITYLDVLSSIFFLTMLFEICTRWFSIKISFPVTISLKGRHLNVLQYTYHRQFFPMAGPMSIVPVQFILQRCCCNLFRAQTAYRKL